MTVKELCRKHGISDVTYYNWKSTYGGMEVSDLRRMKELEAELSQYKRLYAELAWKNDAMKELIAKMYGPPPGLQKPWLARQGGFCTNVSDLLLEQLILAVMEIRT